MWKTIKRGIHWYCGGWGGVFFLSMCIVSGGCFAFLGNKSLDEEKTVEMLFWEMVGTCFRSRYRGFLYIGPLGGFGLLEVQRYVFVRSLKTSRVGQRRGEEQAWFDSVRVTLFLRPVLERRPFDGSVLLDEAWSDFGDWLFHSMSLVSTSCASLWSEELRCRFPSLQFALWPVGQESFQSATYTSNSAVPPTLRRKTQEKK